MGESAFITSIAPAENNFIISDNTQVVSIENGTNEFNLYNDSHNKNTETDTHSDIQCLTGLDEFRRKSVEDYLDMSNSVLSPISLNTKNRKTLLRKEKTKQLKIKRQIESELKIQA